MTPAATALAAAAALGATLLYGIASYTKRNLTGVDSLVVATGTMTAATVVLLPFAVFWWPATPPSPAQVVGSGDRAWRCVYRHRLYAVLPPDCGEPAPHARSASRLSP